MTTDVLKLQGDYLIQTKPAGMLTLDVGGVGLGTVVVNGNLIIKGTSSTVESQNMAVKDNVITLNAGEPTAAGLGRVTAGTSGIKISRGRLGQDFDNLAAFIEWNDNARWNGTGRLGEVTGVFEFRVGTTNATPQYSALKVNAIRIDPSSASTIGAGANEGPRLNIFGRDNPTAVISVSGTQGYAERVVDDDDIPNKKYVDGKLAAQVDVARSLEYGNSYIKVLDTTVDGVPSRIIGVLNGDRSERLNITQGSLVLDINEARAILQGVKVVGNTIAPSVLTNDLIITTNTATAKVIFGAPVVFSKNTTPYLDPGETSLYTGEIGPGGTGVFYASSLTNTKSIQGEFVSKRKALVYSLIF